MRRSPSPTGSVSRKVGRWFWLRSRRAGSNLPGGTIEPGESPEQALVREVAEEACATVTDVEYLACQHVWDPQNPLGRQSYFQSRWWARVRLDDWDPQFEMIDRTVVGPDRFLETLYWDEKTVAARLLELALDVEEPARRPAFGAVLSPPLGIIGVVIDELTRAEEVVRAAVEAFDPATYDGESARRMARLFGSIEKVAAAGRTLAWGRVESSGAWRTSGARSAAHEMATETGSSVGQAMQALRAAEQLESLDQTAAAFRSGQLSVAQVAEVAAGGRRGSPSRS